MGLGNLLFGKNDCDELRRKFLNSSNLTPKQAVEVLDSFTHIEIKEVLRNLKDQMEKGLPQVKYSADGDQYLAKEIGYKNSSPVILFSEEFYYRGFTTHFYNLLDKAFPDYSVANPQPLRGIIMYKR